VKDAKSFEFTKGPTFGELSLKPLIRRGDTCRALRCGNQTMTPVKENVETAAASIDCSCPRHRNLILVLLMALCFISHFNRASITSAGDEKIMAQFQISPEKMGVIYSAFLIVYTVFMIPGGWLIDRRGPQFAMACVAFGSAVFCGFTGGIGFLALTGAQVWFSMIIVRSLMGMLSAPLHPSAARAVGDSFSAERQARANGLITGASTLAYAAVHPVFGGLIDAFNWQTAFLILGGVTGILGMAWLYFAKPAATERSNAVRMSHEPFAPGARRDLTLLTISYAAVGYFQYLFFYWLHYYYDSVLHMTKAESRYYAALPSLAIAFGMPIGGWLTDRAIGWRGDDSARKIVPKIAMLLSSALLLCGIFAKDRFWIVTAFTASLGVLGLCEASFWTVAVNLGKERGGTSAAIMNTGGNGIGLLAPMITPWLGSHLGWQWGLAAGAFIGIIGGLCWFGIRLEQANPK
jgi:ACS family D-galactonate transporter-like MFS transporter